jgi:hypothetical protein
MILIIFFFGIPVFLFFVSVHLNKTDAKIKNFEDRLTDVENKIK